MLKSHSQPLPCLSTKHNMIKTLLITNFQGQPRLLKNYLHSNHTQPTPAIHSIIRKCISRSDKQSAFFDHHNSQIVYRKYASLYFILELDSSENELAALEFLHNIVETMDRYFNKVCELDILFSVDRVHLILDEMIHRGLIVESNKAKVLAPIHIMDQVCASKR